MYQVQFTEPAEADLLSTLAYISDVLKAPAAAAHLLTEIEEQTQILETSPFCNALVEDSWLNAKGIRSLLIKNYHVLYIVKEQEMVVSIIRILYARRDWSALLRHIST